MRFTLQHVGYPTTQAIRPEQWQKYSTHKTVSAAWKALKAATAHLSLSQWDDHYRVIDADGIVQNYGEYAAEVDAKIYAREQKKAQWSHYG